MHALPISPSVHRSVPALRGVLMACLAVAALASLACGDDLPPGARPIAPADTAAPQPAGSQPAGGSAGLMARSPTGAAPHVVALDPPDGAHGVDPSRTTLSVTFDRAMEPQGWAWVVEDPGTAPDIGEAHFDPSGRTNTVDVKLEPNRDYVVWINSQKYTYFKSVDGTPAEPYRWTFHTGPGA